LIGLDVADLVVVAGRTLGIGADDALAQVDVASARAALADARTSDREPGTACPDRADAAAAAAGLVHALLRHHPFPRGGEQVAVAAGLQFLSLNGWRADLDPPATAVVVVEALAAGQLSPDDAAVWLTSRLSPQPAPRALFPREALFPRRAKPPQTPQWGDCPSPHAPLAPLARMLISAMLTLAVGGLALLATACARGPAAPAAHPHGQPAATRPTRAPRPAHAAGLVYPDGNALVVTREWSSKIIVARSGSR
jgi:prophage maintenance system killer protein